VIALRDQSLGLLQLRTWRKSLANCWLITWPKWFADFHFFRCVATVWSSGLVAQKPKIPKAGIKERDVWFWAPGLISMQLFCPLNGQLYNRWRGRNHRCTLPGKTIRRGEEKTKTGNHWVFPVRTSARQQRLFRLLNIFYVSGQIAGHKIQNCHPKCI